MLTKQEFDNLTTTEQDSVLASGAYFLWLHPRSEYYFKKYDRFAEPLENEEEPVFVDSEDLLKKAQKLYQSQYKEAQELLQKAQKVTMPLLHQTDNYSNLMLPYKTSLKRWALASAKILLTKPYMHGWSEEIEKEQLGWEIGERRLPRIFGITLPYSICWALPTFFDSTDNAQQFVTCINRNAAYLEALKMSSHSQQKYLMELSIEKLKMSEGMRRVMTVM